MAGWGDDPDAVLKSSVVIVATLVFLACEQKKGARIKFARFLWDLTKRASVANAKVYLHNPLKSVFAPKESSAADIDFTL
jgi:hypothetical protein